MRRVQAGLVATALDLPPQTFCLECTTSERAGTAALRTLGSGLVLAADGEWAAGILLVRTGAGPGGGDQAAGAAGKASVKATVLAEQSALGEYPGVGALAPPDYAEMAYLDLVRAAAAGIKADRLVLNPPHPRLLKPAANLLGFRSATAAPAGGGAAGSLVGLLQALDDAAPGQTVLLVSYGTGSAADALLVRKEGG
jgi:3-hydroxy-3-methylglutaryl CoA synthase